MNLWTRIFRWKREWESELDEELCFHLEKEIAANIAGGMSAEEARRQAVLRLGGMDGLKDACREQRRGAWLEMLWQDLRYGLRMLRKSPGFAAVAILTLALGIGANAAIFSVVDGILWQPLPYARPSQIVTISVAKTVPHGEIMVSLAPVHERELASLAPAAQQIATYHATQFTLADTSGPDLLAGSLVSGNFFATMGAKPLLGRTITPADAQAGQDAVAVLGYALWRGRFASDPNIIGRNLTLDGRRYTIIGVMPRHFDFGLSDPMLSSNGVWTPRVLSPSDDTTQAAGSPMVGRLKDGVSYAAANAQLGALAPRFWPQLPPIMNGCQISVASILPTLSVLKEPLLVLGGAVAFVLLIACANISALLLERGWSRRREIAVRHALGATRFRIVRQLVSESLLIALAGGVAAIGVTLALMRVLPVIAPQQARPKIAEAHLDWHVLVYLLALSLLACLLFALLPALELSGGAVGAAIKGAVAAPFAALSSRPSQTRRDLVVLEIAAAVVLVVGAALMGRSLENIARQNLGFRTDHVLTASVNLSLSVCNPADKHDVLKCWEVARQIIDGLSGTPGIESAAVSSGSPLSASVALNVRFEDRPGEFGFSNGQMVGDREVTPEYFRTLAIPVVAGRGLASTDSADSERVAVVNRAFAERFFPNSKAVGARFSDRMGAPAKAISWIKIVGIVADAEDESNALAAHQPDPECYVPINQREWPSAPHLIIRASIDPDAILPAVRRQVAAVDLSAPLTNVVTMDQIVANSSALPRFAAVLITSFGALGLILALIGLYGIVSHRVAQRTREIGVRVALGSPRSRVLSLVLGEAVLLALIGVGVGIGGAIGLTRFLASFLFQIKPADPATFAGVATLLIVVALLAAYIPARRALRIDPASALRCE